jgi:hypothetical protein
MFCSPRHRLHRTHARWVLLALVLVWLALVPLRGWAQTSMPLAAAAAAAHTTAEAAMPCHGSEAGAPDQGATSPHTPCSDCALCHAVAAPAPTWVAPLPRPSSPGWQARPGAAPPAHPSEAPFKPPRA